MSISDFASAAQIAMPQVATPSTPGTLVSSVVSGARAGADSFRRLGLSMRFKVVVLGVGKDRSLGMWTSCEGLKVEFKYETVRSGGDYISNHVLPQVVSYGPVTLKRAVEKAPSEAVQSWLRDVAAEWNGSGDMSRIGKIVVIDLLDVYQVSAAHWALRNAFPVSWSGPSLTAKGSEIASETLVLEHEGFLEEKR